MESKRVIGFDENQTSGSGYGSGYADGYGSGSGY